MPSQWLQSRNPRGETIYWVGAVGLKMPAWNRFSYRGGQRCVGDTFANWISPPITLLTLFLLGWPHEHPATWHWRMTSPRTVPGWLTGCGKRRADARVLAAMAELPRHLFVENALAHRAYDDDALPIGHGQIHFQPFTVRG